MVAAFEEATGISVPFQMVDRRPGDIDACYADCTKALKDLGWRTKYELREACRDAWHFQTKNPDGYETLSTTKTTNNNNNEMSDPKQSTTDSVPSLDADCHN